MSAKPLISVFDNVRVRSTPLTQSLGLAGLKGQVHGWTTPSVTQVEVIGGLKEDFAFNVFFEERKDSLWFAPELLEFADHAPGTEITVGKVPKKWTRNEAGEWIESDSDEARHAHRPWWKFW